MNYRHKDNVSSSEKLVIVQHKYVYDRPPSTKVYRKRGSKT